MTGRSQFCLLGYALVSGLICLWCDAGLVARLFGIAGAAPIGFYCGWRDMAEGE